MQQKVACNNRKCEAALIESTLQACALHIMSCLQVNCSSVLYINKDWCCDCASGRAHSTTSFLLLKKDSPCVLSPACPGWKSVWEKSSPQKQCPSWTQGLRLCHPAVAELPPVSGCVELQQGYCSICSSQMQSLLSPRKAYRQIFGNCSSWLVFWNSASFAFVKTGTYRRWDSSTGTADAEWLEQTLRLGTGSILRSECAQRTAGKPSRGSAEGRSMPGSEDGGLKESEGREFIKWHG